MTGRLQRGQVEAHIADLQRRSTLTPLQAARLATVAGLLDGEARFVLRAALVAGEFPEGDARGQEAFQDFRRRVNTAAAEAGVALQLDLDSRKTSPDHRHGWFTGGDLIDEGIAAFTGEAGRTGIAHPVGPEVAELGGSRRTRVYLSAAPRDQAEARRVDDLVKRLREALTLDGERTWELAEPDAVGLGEDPDEARDRLCGQADVRLVLITTSYLTGPSRERERALRPGGRVVTFAFGPLPDHAAVLGGLDRRDVRRRHKPWTALRSDEQRQHYVQDVVDEIHRALRPPSTPVGRPDEHLTAWSAQLASTRRPGDSAALVEPETAETRLSESRLGATGDAHGPALPAVARLVEWATAEGPNAPRLCALLGDVGMGKTTTAKLFTQRLLDLRAAGARCPLPILFDLRDVRITGLVENLTLDGLLDGMLDANRPAGVPRERLCADVVRRRLRAGDAVVVFDGLDEVLVHLSPHDQQVFTRQLWRAIGDGSGAGARMLLTCRTQYFRTIRDEVTFFTGQDRQGLRGEDYLALLMLPFREKQVREYLRVNVDRDPKWVDGFLSTIGAVHDLPDLARRPLTLRLIADQVEFIESAKLAGRTLRSVDLYGEFVERWLARDGGKHTLLPEHKQLLMEEIAAGLWRSGRNSWGPVELDDWLLALLERRTDLRRHYREPLPHLWKADFRTATFLARDGDTFAFGHRSLAEFFLARHLARALAEAGDGGDLAPLAMPVPGPETLDFLGQALAGASPEQRDRALAGLHRIGQTYVPQASELALAYALHAAGRGHPNQSLSGVRLTGARLGGWLIGSDDPARPTPAMTGADLRGADLRRARLHRVDLSSSDLRGADLTLAELHRCDLTGAQLDKADATGTLLRRCGLDRADLSRARTYRTQVLWCAPPPRSGPGLLVAPQYVPGRPESGDSRPRVLTGHTGEVVAVAWSPDGSQLLTGGEDGARVWDATTGEVLRDFGRRDGVWAVAWSPDGARIVVGGRGGARVWDVATGEVLSDCGRQDEVRAVAWSACSSLIVTAGGVDGARVWHVVTGEVLRDFGRRDGVWAVAWSPDNSRIVTDGVGGVRVWDAGTGEVLRDLDDVGGVRAVAWSPDSTLIVTDSDLGSARVWDAETGEVLRDLGRQDGVRAVAWSPDSSRIVTAGGVGGARVWDVVTGEVLRGFGRWDGVWAVAWSSDGSRIVAGGRGGVRVWDVSSGEVSRDFDDFGGVRAVAWSPDNSRIVTDAGAGGARVWHVGSGEVLRESDSAGEVWAVAWSPDGSRIVTAGGVRGARVWDVATGAVLRDFGRGDGVWAVAWSPDGARIVIGGRGGARVWDAATGDVLCEFNDVGVRAVAWSPDSSRIVTAGGKDGARVWDAGTGGVLRDFGRQDEVRAVAWSPDESRIVTGGNVGGARVWDAETGEVLRDLDDVGGVRAVAWSPDSSQIVTDGGRGGARVWDVETGGVLHDFDDIGWISAVAWSSDSTRIAIATDSARFWDAVTGQPVGPRLVVLPDHNAVVLDAATGKLVGASPGAWRWLGWSVVRNNRTTRLPAETYGPLPPLPAAAP